MSTLKAEHLAAGFSHFSDEFVDCIRFSFALRGMPALQVRMLVQVEFGTQIFHNYGQFVDDGEEPIQFKIETSSSTKI